MAQEVLTPEEYARWMRPADAVKHLGTNAIPNLLLRLGMGELRAVARTIRWRTAGDLYSEEFVIIHPDDWAGASDAGYGSHDLWSLGDISFESDDPYGLGREPIVAAFGVRFDPDGIFRIRAPASPPKLAVSNAPPPLTTVGSQSGSPPGSRKLADVLTERLLHHLADPTPTRKAAPPKRPSTSRSGRKPALPAELVKAWYENLPPVDKARGLRDLWNLVREAHPEHWVLRKHVDPFVKNRPRGRPPKQ